MGIAEYLRSLPPEMRGFGIAVYAFTLAEIVSVIIFLIAMRDGDMKLLALGAVISNSGALMGIASTILIGHATKPAKDEDK
jgi:hypothetical protein